MTATSTPPTAAPGGPSASGPGRAPVLSWTAKLGRACARHPRRVVGAWVLLALVLGLLVNRVGPATTDDVTIPGADSQAAIDTSRAAFPESGNPAQRFVVRADSLTTPEAVVALTAAAQALAFEPEVAAAVPPTAYNKLLSTDETIGTIYVTLDVAGKDITKELANRLEAAVESQVGDAGIEVIPADAFAQVLDQPNNRRAEGLGLLAALVILLVAFGSVAAALLPLGVAIVGLAVSILGLGLLGHAVDIPTVAPALASMIGLGVGIDYSLFGLNRYQRALIDGQEPVVAATTTTATAGRAVLFAGFSVIAALSGLALVGMPLMRSLAIASGVAVLVACAASVTLLPAMLAWLGTRLATRKPESLGEAGGWARQADRVARRPWLVLVGSTMLLALLAAPALDLRLGQLDAGSWPTSTQSRQSYDAPHGGVRPRRERAAAHHGDVPPPARRAARPGDHPAPQLGGRRPRRRLGVAAAAVRGPHRRAVLRAAHHRAVRPRDRRPRVAAAHRGAAAGRARPPSRTSGASRPARPISPSASRAAWGSSWAPSCWWRRCCCSSPSAPRSWRSRRRS